MTKGFTLVELLVSIAIFTIVMLMAISSLFSILDLDRKAQSMKSVMNNLNFALDSMAREIRVGSDYCVPVQCNATNFSFHDYLGKVVHYELQADGRVWETREDLSSNQPIPLTAPEVHIENDANQPVFVVIGHTPAGDQKQPYVFMRLIGYAGVGKTQTDFSIQTTVSQRLFDQ